MNRGRVVNDSMQVTTGAGIRSAKEDEPAR